jgi:hypothetical protein
VNIGTQKTPKILKIGAQCFQDEKKKFMDLIHEFIDVFSWSYEDLRGFDASVIQHAILIKEGAIHVRQKERTINLTLEPTIRKEVEK